MHTLTANLNRDINPIINQQRHAEPLRHGMKIPGRLHRDGMVGRFVAILHDGDAASERRFDDGRE